MCSVIFPVVGKHQRQPLEGDWRRRREIEKVGLECPQELYQQSCLISNEKDKSVMAFFFRKHQGQPIGGLQEEVCL
ncbi:hypothetical protein CEXT_312081 [Caerostris extrusa]|uniref:Uncharacterized protein n=1 Tax=Caerostris extrusa TaxID=172846 RepID=A0AAV4WN27_CAEEX|nr:hypothetical protein CEXT_312081 [Caerostris extrusa]